MARAGAVWIDVLPNMAGWNAAVLTESRVALTGTGEEAGRSFTTGLMRMMRIGLSPMRAEVEAQARAAANAAAIAVEQASTRVEAARAKEADAAGKLRVATLKLQEVQDKSSATASSIAAAQERVATAERNHATAAGRLAAEESRLAAAQERVAATTDVSAESAAVAGSRFAGMGTAVGGAVAGMGDKFKSFGKMALGMVGIFGAFKLAQFGKDSVTAAREFQQSTLVLVTAAGETMKNLGLIRAGIVQIADDTGTTTQNLVEGMYTIEKAGYRGAAGLEILKAAAQGAREENASLGIVTNAMTSIMASYGLKANVSAKVMDELKTAAGNAKTTMQDFSGALSTVMPLASRAGLSFAEIGGALGTLTSHGTSADEATQELSNTIRNLVAPNNVAVKEMGQFGISAQQVQLSLGKKGLQGTIDMLTNTILHRMGPSGKILLNTFYTSVSAGKDAARMFANLTPAAQKLAKQYETNAIGLKAFRKGYQGMGGIQGNLLKQWMTLTNTSRGFNDQLKLGVFGSQTYIQALQKMMGGTNGLNTALMLTGSSAAGFTARTNAIAEAYRKGGKTVEGWAATSKTAAVAQSRLDESMKNAGMVLATAFLPAIASVTDKLANGVTWLMQWGSKNWSWLGPVAKGLGIMAGALAAFGIVKSITEWVKGWAVVQALLNTEMGFFDALWAANPIGLIVVGLAALVAGLILAYNKIGWFRDFVNTAWRDIKIATQVTFGWITHTAIPDLAAAIHDIGGFFTGAVKDVRKAWSDITGAFSTAYNWVKDVFKAHWGLIVSIVGGPVAAVAVQVIKHWQQIGDVFRGVWDDFLWPVIDLFGAVVKDLYLYTLAPAFTEIWKAFQKLGEFCKATYDDVLRPMILDLGAAFVWLWQHSAVPVAHGIEDAWSAMGSFLRGVYYDVIKPTFDVVQASFEILGAVLKGVFDHTISPMITAFKVAIGGLVGVFKGVVSDIGSQWHRLEALAMAPVKFVIGTVLNNGLIAAFDKIASIFGTAKIPKIPGFSSGGYTGVGGRLEPAGIVHRGEVVWSQDDVARHGGPQRVDAMRLGLPGYSIGGIVGGVENTVGSIFGGIKHGISNFVHNLTHPVKWAEGMLEKIVPSFARFGSSALMQDVEAFPKVAIKGMVSLLKKGWDKVTGGGGSGGPAGTWTHGGDFVSWWAQAIKVAGPAWAKYENAAALVAHYESGDNPNAVNNWDSNALKGTPSAGLMQFIRPTFDSYEWPGHGSFMSPVDQILAFFRYATARYGSPNNVPGVVSVSHGGPYVGYRDGTRSAAAGVAQVGEDGPELITAPGLRLMEGGEQVHNSIATRRLLGSSTATFTDRQVQMLADAIGAAAYDGRVRREVEQARAQAIAARSVARSGMVPA